MSGSHCMKRLPVLNTPFYLELSSVVPDCGRGGGGGGGVVGWSEGAG